MKVLFTGGDGFIGRHLQKKLQQENIEVVAPIIDLLKTDKWRNTIESTDFDVFVHLAGMSSVPECEKQVTNTFRINVESTYQLASMVAEIQPKAHFIFPSTGQIYDVSYSSEEGHIYSEQDKIAPRNLYALSKFLAEESLRTLVKNKKLKTTVLRIFTHIHKSQRSDFFLASVYQQLLLAKNEGRRKADVVVGNINIERDFGVIQDLISALALLIHRGPAHAHEMNVFQISSGTSKNLKSLIETLAAKMDMVVDCKVDEKLFRGNEPKVINASYDKFRAVYGWKPKQSKSEEILITAFLENL